MIKHVFTDVDFSFFGEEKTASKDNIETIKKLKAKGIGFSFQSGRLACALEPLLDEVGINHSDDNLIVCGNGALICNTNGKVLYERTFKYENAIKLLDYLYTLKDQIFYLVSNEMYYCTAIPKGRVYKTNDHLVVTKEEMYAKAKNEKIFKLALYGNDTERLRQQIPAIEKITNHEVTGVFSSPFFLEVVNSDVDKGSGLKKFCELKGLDIKDVLAIGDNYNDEAMLAIAGHTACPSNAIEEIKKVVDYISPFDSSHNAFTDIVNHFVFEGKEL